MRRDREKWDSRYAKKMGADVHAPILDRYWKLASLGTALDIACGNGRNSLFLAQKGFIVDAVDISTVATRYLTGRDPNINVICTDLDAWHIPPNRYELIVNIRFLDRRLFPGIIDGLKLGGMLVFESFVGDEKNAYGLYPNELLRAFQSLRVVYYEEKKTRHAENFDQTAALVAIKTDSNLTDSDVEIVLESPCGFMDEAGFYMDGSTCKHAIHPTGMI